MADLPTSPTFAFCAFGTTGWFTRGSGRACARTTAACSRFRPSPSTSGWHAVPTKPPSKLTRMAKLLGLRCRECGAEYELQATHVCEMCFGPLDVVYDEASLKKKVSRQRIEQGPASMWRYRDPLPIEDATPVVSLGESFTPLVKADRLLPRVGP